MGASAFLLPSGSALHPLSSFAKEDKVKKSIVLFAAALCLSLPIFGGGGSDKAGPAKQSMTTLKFTYWGSPVEKKAVEDCLKLFQAKYPHISVNAMYIPNADYVTKLTAMIAGNDTPDIGYLNPSQALPWAEEGKLSNINDFLDKDPELKKDDFLDNIWYNWAPGKSLGTNTACEAMALIYNEDIFKAANVELPPSRSEEAWGWEKFVETARTLTLDRNGKNALDPAFDDKNIKQYGVQFPTNWQAYMPLVHSNGGDYINSDGTKLTLSSPEAVEAIQKLSDLINKYHVSPSPVQQRSMPAPAVGLQSKQVAMAMVGQWNLLDLKDAKFNFGLGVLPKLKKSVTLVLGSPTVIFSATKHPNEAWLLYKWLANPESSIDLMRGGLWMPLLKSWYSKPELIAKWAENNPSHPASYKDAVMRQTLENGISGPYYYVKGFGEIDAIIAPALEQVWLGTKTAAQALQEIEPKAQLKLKGRYNNKKQ